MRLRSEDRILFKTTILGQKGHFLSRDYKFTFDSLEEVEIVQRQWVKILYQTVRKRCLLYCLTRVGAVEPNPCGRCRGVHHNYGLIKAKMLSCRLWVLCVWKTPTLSVPVYNSDFSFENAHIWMRLGLSSTLIRWAAWIWKSSWKWIKTETHIVLVLAVEKRTKIKTMTENIAGACACRMRIRINLRHNVQFVVKRLSVNSRKRSKTVVWTRIDRCVVDDNENAYFRKRISLHRASDLNCHTETS